VLGRAFRLSGDAGHRPPGCAEAASGAVVLDGVLHNRAELWADLGDPSRPATDDADLVLRAYQRWGEEALRRLKGTFALLIWDADRGTLLCARDRLGISPLFYADAGQELVFSTSLSAVVHHQRVRGDLNRGALAAHLAHHWARPKETFFAAVKRVPAGHVLRVSRGGRELRRWWDPSPSGPSGWVREDELGRFDELLDQAVSRCLAGGPTAIYLSGGFDSVSVAAVAADASRRQGLPAPVALSLAFPGPECSEEDVQRRVAADLGFPQLMVPFGEAVGQAGLLAAALDMCGTWPAPMLNPWRPAYFHLGLQGKGRGCEAILTGGGGDEWLTVSSYYMADLLRAGDVAGAYRFLVAMLRSYGLPRLAMLRYIGWLAGLRPLLALHARRLLRPVAPGLMRAYWHRRARQPVPA
jgi:asparagine synthase (glutamine-hydrolysing)